MHRSPATCLALLLLTVPAFGQVKIKIPAVPDGAIENLVPVVAPAASLAVTSDTHGWLAFAHHFKYTDAHVTLRRLESEGKLGEPILLKLPRPPALAKYPNYATGLAFHPKLPLFYVWQDIEFPKNEKREPLPLAPADASALLEFDHLLVYSLDKGQPELVVGLGRGPQFAHSRPMGSVAVDQLGERLYIPNLVANPRNTETTIGSYVLHADGMPLVGQPEEGKEDKPGPESRAAHIAAIKAAKQASKPILPQRTAPTGGYAFYPDWAVGSGIGFVPVGRDIVLIGAFHATGLISWAPDDRRCRMLTYHIDSGYTYKLPVGHPTLPLIFVSDTRSPYLFRFEHSDGNITLVPQRADLEGSRSLTSFPVVMCKGTKVAVGAWAGRVFVVGLNEKGKFKPERQQAQVGNHEVEALAYSEKYDRLYVGVEKPK